MKTTGGGFYTRLVEKDGKLVTIYGKPSQTPPQIPTEEEVEKIIQLLELSRKLAIQEQDTEQMLEDDSNSK